MPLPPDEKGFLEIVLHEADGLDSPVLFIMHRIQDEYGMIREEHADFIADRLSLTLGQLYSVATFYEKFSTTGSGRNVIRLCRGIVCHSRDSRIILEAVKDRLGIDEDSTTPDGKVTLECASCIGQCDGSPAMLVNDKVFRDLTVEKVLSIIDDLVAKEDD